MLFLNKPLELHNLLMISVIHIVKTHSYITELKNVSELLFFKSIYNRYVLFRQEQLFYSDILYLLIYTDILYKFITTQIVITLIFILRMFLVQN